MDRISLITLALAKKFTKKSISALEQVVRYIGVTTTEITDGSTTNPITINGQSVTVVAGDTVFYNGTSYSWEGNAWQEVMNIAEIITVVEALGGKVHDILGDIAPEFNSASTYAVDDIVLYEDDLYIFTNAHTGAWDSSDVTVTSIAQLVDDLRAEIASTNGRVSALEAHVTQSGDVIDSDNHSLHIVGEAIETEKTATGNPITVTDALPYNAVSLSAEIEASQDLHGFDKPWAGGAGKNKIYANAFDTYATDKNPSDAITGIKGGMVLIGCSSNAYIRHANITSYTIHENDIVATGADEDAAASYGIGIIMPVEEGQSYTIQCVKTGGEVRLGWLDSTGANISYTGAQTLPTTVSPATGASYLCLVLIPGQNTTVTFSNIMVEKGSSATSYEPYSNICPISGRTEARVDDVGKNLYVGSPSFDGYTNIETYTVSSETYNGHEIIYKNTAWSGAYKEIALKAGVTYTFSAMVKCATEQRVFIFSKNAELARQNIGNTWTRISAQITPTEDVTECLRVEGATAVMMYVSEYQLEYGSQATDYVPYRKTATVTIQLGQTVYGAKINFKTGEGIVDTAKGDLSTLTWYYENGNKRWAAANFADMLNKSGRSDNIIFEKYKTDITAQTGDEGKAFNANGWIYIYTSDGENSPTGDCAYYLATPTTIQLTPTQLTMLKGYNRLSSDGGGDITLTYRANKADSVQAEVDVLETTKADNADVVDYIENGNTASRAYSANQFILWKGDLYKVMTSIASGATITAGTNVSKTTIGAVLTAILNA